MELNKLSASELLEGLSKKDFSPKDVLDDCVKRIEKIDPALNAFPINVSIKLMIKSVTFHQ